MAELYVLKRLVDGYAQRVTPLEVRFMLRLAWWRDFPWLTAFFRLLSRLGDGPLWGAIGVTLLLFGTGPERRAVLAGAMAALTSVLLFSVLKGLIRRPRPFDRWSSLSGLVPTPDRFSFPSGHTMTAFAMYASLGGILPMWGWVLLPTAWLIGLSRVYLGVHYPTDVLVGALLGTLVGKGAVWAVTEIGTTVLQ